jgi:hypothetical protein
VTVIPNLLQALVVVWLSTVLVACVSDSPVPEIYPSDAANISTDPDLLVETALTNELQQPLTLSVSTRREDRDWLLLGGKVNSSDGSQVDYSNTQYQAAIKDGVFDNVFVALLQRTVSTNNIGNVFELLELSFGSTDSPIGQWQEKYQLPDSLTGMDKATESLQWQ